MPAIELGEPGSAPAPRSARGAARARRPALVLLAVLCLLAVTGAERAGPPAVRLLWSVPVPDDAFLALGGGAVFVKRGGTLESYDLGTGRRRWGWRTGRADVSVPAPPADGPLLVLTDPEGAARSTVALDAGTGAELWRQPGEVRGGSADASSRLLVRYSAHDIVELLRVRAGDGAAIWRRTVAPVRDVVLETGSDDPRLVTVSESGEVTVLRYADAAPVAAGRLDRLAANSRYAFVEASRGRLFAVQMRGDRARSAVHDLATLRELWHTGSVDGSAVACRSVLCGFTRGEARGYDIDTGRELWRRAGATGFTAVTADRMLIILGVGDGHLLIDSRTGRQIGGPVRGWVAPDEADETSMLLLRPAAGSPGSAVVTRLDLRTGAQRTLGSVAVVPNLQRCRADGAVLACVGRDRLVVVSVPR